MKKISKLLSTICAFLAALIMLQTLYFKFTGAEESVYIFSKLGMEPIGRIGVGIAELIASLLLIIPTYRLFGCLLGIMLMAGALFAHLTILHIEVLADGGYLFSLCLAVLVFCTIGLFIEIEKFKLLLKNSFIKNR